MWSCLPCHTRSTSERDLPGPLCFQPKLTAEQAEHGTETADLKARQCHTLRISYPLRKPAGVQIYKANSPQRDRNHGKINRCIRASVSVSYVVFLDHSQCFQVHLLQHILPLRCPTICPGEASTIIYHHLPSPIKSSPYNTAQQQLIQGHVPRKRVFYTRCGLLKCIFITFFLKLSLSNKVCPTALSEGIERKKEMSDGSFGFRSTRCVHLQFEIPALISPYTCRSLAARDPHCACWSALEHSQHSPLLLASVFSFDINVLDGRYGSIPINCDIN